MIDLVRVVSSQCNSVCDKNNSTNNSIQLEKGQIHSGITLTVCDERIAEIPSDHQKNTNLVYIEKRKKKKEKSVGIAKQSIRLF